MKFYLQLIATDEGWRRSGGVTAALSGEFEGQWLAMNAKDADRLEGFLPTKFRDIMLSDGTYTVRYVPLEPPEPPEPPETWW